MHMLDSYAGEEYISAYSAYTQCIGCELCILIGAGMLSICMKLPTPDTLVIGEEKENGND